MAGRSAEQSVDDWLAEGLRRSWKAHNQLPEERGLKVKLLPSRAGSDSQHQALTSFLINDCLAVDGGSIGFALAPDDMLAYRHIVVTHAHSDHTASLPIFVAEVFPKLLEPVVVYAQAEVISDIRRFIFNDHIWPD